MRTHHLIFVIGLSAAFAAPAAAQVVKKTEAETHHVLKSTGRAIKADAKEVGGKTHHVLQKAGNGTKTELGRVTGVHKVGGSVGAAAQKVSRSGKHLARKTKSGIKHKSSAAHHELKKNGNEAKAQIKPEQ